MVSLYQLYFIALALVFQTVSSSNTRLHFSLVFCLALERVDYGTRSNYAARWAWLDESHGKMLVAGKAFITNSAFFSVLRT
jgi:hypothetical protein